VSEFSLQKWTIFTGYLLPLTNNCAKTSVGEDLVKIRSAVAEQSRQKKTNKQTNKQRVVNYKTLPLLSSEMAPSKGVFIATQLNSTQLTQLNSVQPSQSCFCL